MAGNDRKLSSFDEMGYDNSTKVLVPVVKYSDNTPQAIKENRNIPLELFYKHIFLKSEWVDYIINDPSWLRADTFSWHSGDSNEANSYVKVYDHLLNDIAGKSLISETIAGITIQYYLADDKHKICPASQENNVLSLYNSVGVAWYYIIDTTNQRFKLPRTKFGFVGVRDNVGNYVEPTVPNITGGYDTGDRRTHIVGTSGAFYMRQVDSNLWAGMSSSSGNLQGVGFDASRSNSTYKNGATVQQPATQMYLYFYVGEYTMSSLENIAGENTELFNGKLDIDLSNITQESKRKISNMSSPNMVSSSLIAMGNNSTCPTDGVLMTIINCDYGHDVAVRINGIDISGNIWTRVANYSGVKYTNACPVSKGDIITFAGYTSYITNCYFCPTKGGV